MTHLGGSLAEVLAIPGGLAPNPLKSLMAELGGSGGCRLSKSLKSIGGGWRKCAPHTPTSDFRLAAGR
jgi:hypothetical protein